MDLTDKHVILSSRGKNKQQMQFQVDSRPQSATQRKVSSRYQSNTRREGFLSPQVTFNRTQTIMNPLNESFLKSGGSRRTARGNSQSFNHSRNFRTQAGKVFDQSRESANVFQPLHSREFGTLSDNGDKQQPSGRKNNQESGTQASWAALGRYIAKQMMNGKGVWVPKLGQFTFTGMTVDLKGSTNPHSRDRQDRFPVFLVGKDFVSGVNIRPGITDGMTNEVFDEIHEKNPLHTYGNRLRPFAMHGQSGIIPKVKANYFEVSMYTEGACNKDVCRAEIEATCANLAALVRQGQSVEFFIPQVGMFKVKDGIAGVIFEKQIIAYSRGQTARNYEHRMLGNNWVNDKIYEPDRTNLGQTAVTRSHQDRILTPDQPSTRLYRGPRGWKRVPQIDLNETQPESHHVSGMRLFSPQHTARVNGFKSVKSAVKNGDIFDFNKTETKDKMMREFNDKVKQYQDKLAKINSRSQQRNPSVDIMSRVSGNSAPKSILSATSTTMSRLPELAPFQFMNMAHEIYVLRQKMIDALSTPKFQTLTMRDLVSSSKIQQIMTFCGHRIDIGHMKALLRELGFKWNGAACSLQHFFQQIKEYLSTENKPRAARESNHFDIDVNLPKTRVFNCTAEETKLIDLKVQKKIPVIDIVREVFYNSKKTLYQIFREFGNGQDLQIDQFVDTVNTYSGSCLNESDLIEAFKLLCVKFGKQDTMNFRNFQAIFTIDVPKYGSQQSEIKVIQKVREWMFVKQFSTICAFERLIRSVGRLREKSLRRLDLHMSLVDNNVELTMPQIDFFFEVLTNDVTQKEVYFEQWNSKIFDDALNPLSMIREIIVAEGFDADDVLFQMKLSYHDEPLDYSKFQIAIRRLDPTFSEVQCKSLFNKLRNDLHKVELQPLLSNLCGSILDTVDYKAKFYRDLYKEIYSRGLDMHFLNILEQDDEKNDGKIEPGLLEKAIKRATGDSNSKYSINEIRKFVRQLPRDGDQKVSYLDLIEKLQGLGSKTHNLFKDLVGRLKFFVEANNLSYLGLLRRYENPAQSGKVPVEDFAEFMKEKINKKLSIAELENLSHQIDVDKDGYIGEIDLRTCISNLKSISFFKNEGSALNKSQFNTETRFFPTSMNAHITAQKALEVCKRIRQAMMDKKLSYHWVFNVCDVSKVGMINFPQFQAGINSFVEVSPALLEKLFDLMDLNKIGMIDFDMFITVLKSEAASQIPKSVLKMEDSFIWQEEVVNKIKAWVKRSKVTAIEAFRSFDQDFDGLISMDDMTKALIQLIKYRKEEISPERLDRLFRVLSFFKSDQIQPSDFQRLLEDINPFEGSATGMTAKVFHQSMGGGFSLSSVNNWKLSAIHQIGLTISLKYTSIDESFYDASQQKDKVNYKKFKEFIIKHDALRGFNLTESLYQKLYAELDPHKKTFLNLADWKSAFQTFNYHENLMVELKNFLQVQFANVESAFAFYQSFGNSQNIDFLTFSRASQSLIATRKLSDKQLRHMFNRVTGGERSIFDQSNFESEFANIQWKGKQVINTHKGVHQMKGNTNIDSKKRGSQLVSKWESEIIEKLRRIIKNSGKSIDAIFAQFDIDGSGDITGDEFKQAIKMISLGITDTEIDRLMQRVDANMDGYVSYLEFAAKFRDDPVFDARMKIRANDLLAEYKEKMIMYMTSATDAYRMFDSSREGKMTYLDWDKLIRELCKLSITPVPCYSVIKDMFDTIDMKNDQLLDADEWNATFGGIMTTGAKVSVKATPLTYWENGLEATKLGQCLARSRKLLIEAFRQNSTHSDHSGESRYVTLLQTRAALEPVLKEYFKDKYHFITDEKLACMMRVGQVVQKMGTQPDLPIYDFMKVLNIYKDRHQRPQCIN